MALLTPVLSYDALGDADIVIEAVFETMEVKRTVFATLDRVDEAGRDTRHQHLDARRERDRAGNEAARGRAWHALLQSRERHAAARNRARRAPRRRTCWPPRCSSAKTLRKTAGGLRRLRRIHRQSHAGAVRASRRTICSKRARRPQQIDAAMEAFGFAMGPFRVGDLAGNDIGWSIRKRRYAEQPELPVLQAAGQAVRARAFRPEDRRGLVRLSGRALASRSPRSSSTSSSRRIAASSASRRARSTMRRSSIASSTRWSTRARGFSKRRSRRALPTSTWFISPVMGFRRSRGGPMFYADTVGLLWCAAAHARVRAQSHGDPEFWTPAPLHRAAGG